MAVKRFYANEWNRFRHNYLKIFLAVLVIFLIISILSHNYLVNHPDQAYQRIAEFKERLLGKIPIDATGLRLFLAIFMNNFRASFFAILLGLIPFLFLPILGIFRNGFLFGAVTAMIRLNGWNVASYVLRYFAPHGIFELPAMLYSVSMGIFLSLQITKKILNIGPGNLGKGSLFHQEETQEQEESFFTMMARVFRSWIAVVVPLLLIGALIEAFITAT